MGLINWFKKTKKRNYEIFGKSPSENNLVWVKPLYVTILKKKGKWKVMSKLEGGRWLSVMDNSGDVRRGNRFPGFTDYKEAKKAALQWSKILKVPFKEGEK